eukprot:TRINITY_DN49224_c0_g1_i1.p1 TRINITY_DN49224_c0_g1~~TRINITY_DN49224_c0_g1_i1.p1  ORF type:complete len:323 (-),score=36.00 TRINITY_DN49224_c0_g1_i1:67-1035(-)
MASGRRQWKELTVVHGKASCCVALVDGAEHVALVSAVNACLRLGGSEFYLTTDDGRAVVPLTSALPGGMTLNLHLQRPCTPLADEVPCRSTALVVTPSSEDSAASSYVEMSSCAQTSKDVVKTQLKSEFSHTSTLPLLASPKADESVSSGRCVTFDTTVDQTLYSNFSELPRRQASSDTLVSHNSASSNHDVSIAITNQMEQAAETIDRFSRLSTDLSNERTLLAWIRTAMAATRTSIAFLALTAEGVWLGGLHLSRMAMVTLVLTAAVGGIVRYRSVKAATFLRLPPRQFGRLSIHWFIFFTMVSVSTLVMGMYSQNFQKR